MDLSAVSLDCCVRESGCPGNSLRHYRLKVFGFFAKLIDFKASVQLDFVDMNHSNSRAAFNHRNTTGELNSVYGTPLFQPCLSRAVRLLDG